MSTELITLQEAAERLGVHYMTAYRYVRTGRLPARKVGAEWRVDLADVEAFTRVGDDAVPPRRRKGTTDYRGRLVERLIAGDEPGTWTIVEQAMTAGLDPEQVYLDLLAPAMEEVGDRWAAGTVSVGEEHQASAVVLRLIGRMGPRMRRRGRSRGTVVLGAPPGDDHGVPVALLGDLLRSRGFAVVDMGANVPAESFAEAAAGSERLVGVGIGATTLGNDRGVRAAVRAVRAATDTAVVLGGAAVTGADHARRLGGDAFAPKAPQAIAVFEALANGEDLPQEAALG